MTDVHVITDRDNVSRSQSATSDAGYLTSLTTIRGLACMVVLFGHVVQVVHWGTPSSVAPLRAVHAVVAAALNAEAAVVVFFVLSGCVLSLSLRRQSGMSGSVLADFYVRRVFRIYPLLIVSLPVAVISMVSARALVPTHVLADWLARNVASSITVRHTLLSLTGAYTEFNGPMWSLRVELVYSAVFPLLLASCRTPPGRLITIAALGVLALLPAPHELGLSFALAFAVGATIPLWSRRWLAAPLPVAIAVAVLLFDRASLSSLHWPDRLFDVVETGAAAIVISAAFHARRAPGFLLAGPLAWLGERSYSVYLLHLPIFLMLFRIGTRWFGQAVVVSSPIVAQLCFGVVTAAVTIAVSHLTYEWVELPLHQRGRQLGRMVRERRTSPLTLPGASSIATR